MKSRIDEKALKNKKIGNKPLHRLITDLLIRNKYAQL